MLFRSVRALSFSTLFLDPVGQTLKGFRFTDSYFYIQNSSTDISEINTDIILFDISGCNSRLEIANAIQRLNNYGARVIALDIIFANNSVNEDFVNDSLTNVIARTNNLITASRVVPLVDTFIVESSYFVEKTNCTEACVNVEIETVRNFNKTLRFGDLELSTFTNEILRLGYPEDYNKLQNRNNESELINYKRMLFETIHINQYYEEEDINGKVKIGRAHV